jgi:hypothetical protein
MIWRWLEAVSMRHLSWKVRVSSPAPEREAWQVNSVLPRLWGVWLENMGVMVSIFYLFD